MQLGRLRDTMNAALTAGNAAGLDAVAQEAQPHIELLEKAVLESRELSPRAVGSFLRADQSCRCIQPPHRSNLHCVKPPSKESTLAVAPSPLHPR